MFLRILSIFGILMALFGMFIVPGITSRYSRRRYHPIMRLNPDESDLPWDLSGLVPVGIIDSRGPWVRTKWTMLPLFRRVK